MSKLDGLKKRIQSIPEFSEGNFRIVGYVAAALISLTGLWLVYEVIANDVLTFSANWNMFNNMFGSLCLLIGLVCAIIFWGRYVHWSSTPYLVTRDKRTGEVIKVEENHDISEWMLSSLLIPIFGHFIIEPIIYGALIYYPVQCVIAILGGAFPYIMSLVILAIVAGSWMYTRVATFRYRSALLVALGILLIVAFGYGAYSIHDKYAPHPVAQDSGDEVSFTEEVQTVTEEDPFAAEADQTVTEEEQVVSESEEEQTIAEEDQTAAEGEEGASW